MIDTLILSACGMKGIYYIGVFKSLLEKNIIQRDNIKNILCCSSGCLFGLLFLLGYSLEFIEKIVISIDFEKLFNYDDLIDLFSDNGLFEINKFMKIFKNILIHKGFNEYITFKELYENTDINYVLKVYNYTDKKDEYISYINHPDLSVIKAISMSCSIPIIFKTIQYKNKIYIDGGITGSTPIINDTRYNNFICIKLKNKKFYNKSNETIYTYIMNIFEIGKEKTHIINKNNITVTCCKGIRISDFSLKECDKIDMINYAKLCTDIHIDRFL